MLAGTGVAGGGSRGRLGRGGQSPWGAAIPWGGLGSSSRALSLLLLFAVACRAALLLPEQCLTLLQPAACQPRTQPLPRAGFSAPFFSVLSHLRSLQLCQAGC